MNAVWPYWGVSAVVLIGAAAWLGSGILKRGKTGILIDNRGRYSLTHFQVVLWTIVVLSLISGLFVARVIAGVGEALSFVIPEQLLIAMGISLGGAAASIAIKAGKDDTHPSRIAASNSEDRPRFAQVFLLEEGDFADRVVDVTKFQNFWLTLILVAAFVVLTFTVNMGKSVAQVVLPSFSGTLLTLLGISHAGYLVGKLPDKPGSPEGLSLALKRQGAVPAQARAALAGGGPTYTPRNPVRP